MVICYERGFLAGGCPSEDDEDNRSERPRAWFFRTHVDFVGPVQQDEGGIRMSKCDGPQFPGSSGGAKVSDLDELGNLYQSMVVMWRRWCNRQHVPTR